MKPGRPTRLSEKLNADMDAIRKEHFDLMASQLANFRADMSITARSAQDTIEADTRRLVESNRNWFEELKERARDCVTVSPWLILWIALAGTAVTMIASFFWAAYMTRSEIQEMGLTRITRDDHTWLIMDAYRTELKTCTLANAAVMCLKIREK